MCGHTGAHTHDDVVGVVAEITPSLPDRDNARVGSVPATHAATGGRNTMIRMMAIMFVCQPAAVTAEEGALQCRPFHQIYANGSQLCENMWDDAFSYSTSDNAYSFWFWGDNPNDKVTDELHNTTLEQCHLNYYHKDTPSAEGNMTECRPWAANSCCYASTVSSPYQLKNAYGEGYQWDRCGPLSQACERYFVMEACFYECEPSAGLYRFHPPGTNTSTPGYNEWQMHRMPIKAAFCDDWYTACYNDMFCSVDGGSFFSCAVVTATSSSSASHTPSLTLTPSTYPSPSFSPRATSDDDENSPVYVGVIVALGVAAVAGLACVAMMVVREKKGKPIFVASVVHPPEPGMAGVGSTSSVSAADATL